VPSKAGPPRVARRFRSFRFPRAPMPCAPCPRRRFRSCGNLPADTDAAPPGDLLTWINRRCGTQRRRANPCPWRASGSHARALGSRLPRPTGPRRENRVEWYCGQSSSSWLECTRGPGRWLFYLAHHEKMGLRCGKSKKRSQHKSSTSFLRESSRLFGRRFRRAGAESASRRCCPPTQWSALHSTIPAGGRIFRWHASADSLPTRGH